MQQKKLVALLYLLTAVIGGFQYVVVNHFFATSFSAELLEYRYAYWARTVLLAVALSILGFGFASFFVLKAPRLAHGVSAVAACLGWPYLIAWFLTIPDIESGVVPHLVFCFIATLAAILLLAAVTSFLLMRLFNTQIFRNTRSPERGWPAYATFVLLVSGLFFGRNVLKPKVIIEAGARPQFSIAHVQKRGRDIQETNIFVMKDHRYFVERVRQRWFWLTPECTQFLNVLPPDNFQAINSVFQSPGFKELQTTRKTVPSQWHSETWYLSVPDRPQTHFLVFTTADQSISLLPKGIVDWFNETVQLPNAQALQANGACSIFSNSDAAGWQKSL